jgi:molybdopterin synthase sulfur carrier subunit
VSGGQRATEVTGAVRRVRVRLYATLRAVVGAKTVELPLGQGATVLDLAAALVERCPALAEHVLDEAGGLSRRVHVMVDGRNVRWLPQGARTVLKAGHEVAIFPPAAGG